MRTTLLRRIPSRLALVALLVGSPLLAQQDSLRLVPQSHGAPDTARAGGAPAPAAAAPVGTPPGGGIDTVPRTSQPESQAYFMVDTIVVVEDVKGLVWGDWYVNPEVGAQVAQAIQRQGQLSGRTWLQSSAPIQDLALGPPTSGRQTVSFVDKGVALKFWEAGEVMYSYLFDGPWGMRAEGSVESGQGGSSQRVGIPLPIEEPPDRASLAARQRVGRLDIAYSPADRSARIPRGRFSVYLYYLNPQLGYRIAGVGY